MRKKIAKIFRLALSLITLLAIFGLPTRAYSDDVTTQLRIDPAADIATTCSNLTISVRVEDVVDLTGYHLEISFDPDVIEVLGVVNGGFLDGDDAFYEPDNEIDNVNGLIRFGMAQRGDGAGDPDPKSGAGDLILITLTALVPNQTTDIEIDTVNSLLVDWPDAYEIAFEAVDGVITTESCPPTDLELSKASLPENEPIGTEIGVFASEDPEPGDTFTYTLEDNVSYPDNLAFTIAGDRLLSGEVFDYETQSSYTIQVRTTDAGGQYFEKVFIIDIEDLNEAPVVGDDVYSTLRNVPLVVDVPGVLTNDYDPEGESLIAIKTSDPPAGQGVVVLGWDGDFSYHPPTNWTGTTSFTYKAYDGEFYSSEVTVTIHVNESNEPPTDLAISGNSIDENEPAGTVIGTFVTVDPDIPYDTFTYELVPCSGVNNNDSFKIVGAVLQSNESFNYEEKSTYRICVRSTDQGGESVEKAFMILVLDVNDPPVAHDQEVVTVENTEIEITLTAFDEDGDDLTFEILIGPVDGTLSGAAPDLVYTPGKDYTGSDIFTFRAWDGELWSDPATVTIITEAKDTVDYYLPLFMHSGP